MAQYTVTASTETVNLFSKRAASDQWGNWSTATWTPTMVFSAAIPKGAKQIAAVLTVNVVQDPVYGSYFFVDDQKLGTGIGTKTIAISVDAGTSKRSVKVSFTGTGKTGTLSQLSLNMSLAVTYDYSDSPLQRVENGALVKYKLYHAESKALTAYNVYRAENGALIRY